MAAKKKPAAKKPAAEKPIPDKYTATKHVMKKSGEVYKQTTPWYLRGIDPQGYVMYDSGKTKSRKTNYR